MAENKIICLKCNKEMKMAKGSLIYLENTINYEFVTCPECKTVYIPEELAEGKMHEIEMALEDK